MKVSRMLIWCVVPLVLAGCASLNQGKLVDDQVSKDYIEENIGEVTYRNLYFSMREDFESVVRIAKEEILASDKLTDQEKEEQMAAFRNFKFVEQGYLAFFFRLHAPTIVKQDQYQIIFNDRNGDPIIDRILMTSNKVTISSAYGSQVSYNYVWLAKLRKPFTPENYEPGTYNVTVVYPNSQKLVYEVTN
ncbi:hypothetical protein [Salinispira pacifica]